MKLVSSVNLREAKVQPSVGMMMMMMMAICDKEGIT